MGKYLCLFCSNFDNEECKITGRRPVGKESCTNFEAVYKCNTCTERDGKVCTKGLKWKFIVGCKSWKGVSDEEMMKRV